MIVRIHSRGTSFKGLAGYLTHDPKAETAERIGWTHTLNCANDDVPSVVNEMLWTARDAELLKQEAGIRAGGRATENTVKHLSLNWSPDEKPTREHMIATSEEFLRHMGWQDHQALIVAHTDTAHAHAHVMLNTVHPVTGLKLDDNFERRRAQVFALEYERVHGMHCENRLEDICDRERSPTRPVWQAFQGIKQDFEDTERKRAAQADQAAERDRELNGPAEEWKALKKIQREERIAFFDEGRAAFKAMRGAVYREVREDFRPLWADYYAAKKDGEEANMLKEWKEKLVAEQKTVLQDRRDVAYSELRETRDALYQELLAGQRSKRHLLTERQEEKRDSLDAMEWFRTEVPRQGSAARDISQDMETHAHQSHKEARSAASRRAERESSTRSGADVGARIATGAVFGLLKLLDFGANAFSPPSPEPTKPTHEPANDDIFARAAADIHLREQVDRNRARATADDEEERRGRRSARSQQ